jgi:hypothetical protein
MNKAQFINVLAQNMGTDRRQATDVLENFVDTIVRTVHSGDSVTITGFGVFEQHRGAAVFRPDAQFEAVVSGAHLPEEGPPAEGGVQVIAVGAVPVTTTNTESSEVKRSVSGPVLQNEAQLIRRFKKYLEAHQREVKAYRIPVGSTTLQNDLADITDKVLYEAKGSAERMSVRLALGQVLDYGRYIEGSRLAVLLPEAPAADLVELLELHDVGCVVETTPENFIDMTTLTRCP